MCTVYDEYLIEVEANPMAIAVMLVIIILNIALLIAVMRVGTQGDHHSELSAEQSSAVLALRDRLGIKQDAVAGDDNQ
jgi:uncharacterized membrane protein YdfJ with MMPL/SSD domain